MPPPSGSPGPHRARQNPRFAVPTALPVEVDRRHIYDRIERGGNAKVVLLVAPSGYGKTTALAQWARRQKTPVVWLRLNEEDKDPKTLLADLAQASTLAEVRMENWDRVSLLDANREQLTAALAEDLNAHTTDLTFVLDGGERLGSDAARALTNLITALGEGHRFLIAQHAASSFSAAPFLARGEGLLIPADELAFTAEDTRAAAQHFGTQNKTITVVHEQYQGWPAGVMLALYTHQAPTPVPGTVLVQELIDALPEDIGRVLPQLAVVNTWSVEEVQHLDIPLPAGWLDVVLRAGLPLTPLGGGKFAPHDVVREWLTEQLRQDVSLWRLLHLKVGQQAEANGQPYSAIQNYVRAGREDLAMRLAEELTPRWYRAADWLLVREALEDIPTSRLTPPLRSLLALALLETGEAERGRDLAQEQLRLAPTPTAHLALSLDAYRAGNMPLMIEHIEAGLAVATEQRDIIQLLRFKAAYLQSVRQLDAGLTAADEAVRRADAIGDVSLKIAALSVKAFILEQKEERDLALQEHQRAYLAGQQLGLTNRLMPIVDRLASLYLSKDRADEAAQLLEAYLTACERNYPLGVPVTQLRLAEVRHAQGRVDEGVQLARQAFDEFLRQQNFSIAADALMYFFYTELLWGQQASAVAAFDRLRLLMGEDREKLTSAAWISRLKMLAYLAYSNGQLEDALYHLDQATAETLEVYNVRHVLTEGLRAEIMRVRGQLDRTHADGLAQSLEGASEELAHVRMVHPHFEPLLREFIRRGWHAPLFKGVLQRCLTTPDQTLPPLQLHLSTLGRVSITLNGQNVRLGHVSAIEALVYRILHPQARQDELADRVWDGVDLKRARQSAHTARNTLNASFREAARASGVPFPADLILPGQGRRNPEWVINDAVQVTCDAQVILGRHEPREVLRLYGGPFLPDSKSEWVEHHREVVNRHVVRLLQEAAAQVEVQDPRTALAWLIKAADLAQTPEAFERVIALSRRMGEAVLTSAAEEALRSLAAGQVATLSRLYSLN